MDNAIRTLEADRVMDVRTMEIADVRAVIRADHPQLAETIAQRQAWDVDRRDEVWEGRYVMPPDPTVQHGMIQLRLATHLLQWTDLLGFTVSLTFNLGEGPRNFRIPDLGIHATEPRTIFTSTALVAMELLSPTEAKNAKFGFYAGQGVGEIWIALPQTRTIEIYLPAGDGFELADTSPLLSATAAELAAFPWPEPL